MKTVSTDGFTIGYGIDQFRSSFSQALGYGRDIKTAFQLDCGLIDLQNLSEQDTPKLITATGIDPSVVLLLEA